jgi:hypothetical protein
MKWNLFLLLALTMATPAGAHTNEYLDTIDGVHGGRLRMSGPYHFELVATPGELIVYVTDHGNQAIDTARGSARVLVRNGKEKVEFDLMPAGGNVFRGRREFALTPATTVHLKVTLPGAPAEIATFSPLRKPAVKPAHEGHQDRH